MVGHGWVWGDVFDRGSGMPFCGALALRSFISEAKIAALRAIPFNKVKSDLRGVDRIHPEMEWVRFSIGPCWPVLMEDIDGRHQVMPIGRCCV